MGRKNRRRKVEYQKRLGFNPKKYISKSCGGFREDSLTESATGEKPDCVDYMGKPYRYISKQFWKHQVSIPRERAIRKKSESEATESIVPTDPGRKPQRGDIWFVYLGTHPGTHVQDGCRPAIVLSNDVANGKAETLTVIPVTSKHKRLYYPTHVLVGGGDTAITRSMALIEQITTIPLSAVGNYAGKVTDAEMKEIAAGIAFSFGLNSAATISRGGIEHG